MKQYIAILLTLVLTGCGGGGGGGPSGSSPNSTSSPGPVSGLHNVMDITGQSFVKNVAVGDLNNDGLDDVVIGGWAGPNTPSPIIVLIQNADGTMSNKTADMLPVSSYSGSQRIFIKDFDGDGRNDIFIPGFNDGCAGGCAVHSMVFWNRPGVFLQYTLPELTDSHGACYADVDSDGDLDVLVAGSQNGATGGMYVNNGNRTFTLNTSVVAGATCSIVKESDNTTSIITGQSNQVAGFRSAVTRYDSNLNIISHTGINSAVNSNYDLINSIALDVNNDGNKDFILMFNDPANNTSGSKEVWTGDGLGGYAYSYTIDTGLNNQYHSNVFQLNGVTTIYFAGCNDQARLYQLVNGLFTPYKQQRFTQMAVEADYFPGFTWSVDAGVVYQNTSTGKQYMLQLIRGIIYTEEL